MMNKRTPPKSSSHLLATVHLLFTALPLEYTSSRLTQFHEITQANALDVLC
ncbi:hypothetical protein RBSWK_05099 [Rhodopirellula baltica SWK14]|uniref:Uncharacterized protein n=1 Tax=Rhodopirellula baltica SWK14 TaxID=993516 RepID=L7C9W0_RHOBT|nr:hypothetical protein RBSWK_05099 [Rhodopirellula baltica SWK14]